MGVVGWYANYKFEETRSLAIVGRWLIGAQLTKQTFLTVSQQLPRNLPVLAQLLCATRVLFENITVCILYNITYARTI